MNIQNRTGSNARAVQTAEAMGNQHATRALACEADRAAAPCAIRAVVHALQTQLRSEHSAGCTRRKPKPESQRRKAGQQHAAVVQKKSAHTFVIRFSFKSTEKSERQGRDRRHPPYVECEHLPGEETAAEVATTNKRT